MKKILFIVGPLLLVGGGVVGAAMMGMVQIPGLSPAKKKGQAAVLYAEKKDEPVASKPKPKVDEPVEKVPDLEKGRAELAKLWSEMDSTVIVKMVSKWSDEDLARQLRYLELDKTAEILSLMDAEKASKISKVLQAIGSSEPPVKS